MFDIISCLCCCCCCCCCFSCIQLFLPLSHCWKIFNDSFMIMNFYLFKELGGIFTPLTKSLKLCHFLYFTQWIHIFLNNIVHICLKGVLDYRGEQDSHLSLATNLLIVSHHPLWHEKMWSCCSDVLGSVCRVSSHPPWKHFLLLGWRLSLWSLLSQKL